MKIRTSILIAALLVNILMLSVGVAIGRWSIEPIDITALDIECFGIEGIDERYGHRRAHEADRPTMNEYRWQLIQTLQCRSFGGGRLVYFKASEWWIPVEQTENRRTGPSGSARRLLFKASASESEYVRR